MHVTVCICTRNRGASIARTIQALRALEYDDFDVVLVDQSTEEETTAALGELVAGDVRYTYLRSATRGSSTARNIALAHAVGPIIAFTDDDCDVSPQWLSRIVWYFHTHPDVAQICGEVRPAPHDEYAGFIPTHPVPRMQRVASPWLKWRDHGISANMAFRKEALKSVGPWDEVLGTGGPLFACTDGDMTYRMLRAGYTLLDVSDAYVTHHGFRNWQEGRPMMRRVGIGVGAAYMKHLRLGDVAVLPTLLIEWLRCVRWGRLLLLRRRSGLARFLFYVKGMRTSFRYRIDRATRTYIASVPAATESEPADSAAQEIAMGTPGLRM